MPDSRLILKITLPPEVLAVVNERARELGCTSPSSLLEALAMADRASPVPGLGAAVARIEQGMRTGRAERGQASIPAARAARRRNPSEPEAR
jgi:outer membrane murein-binding lipoprotein Lpp